MIKSINKWNKTSKKPVLKYARQLGSADWAEVIDFDKDIYLKVLNIISESLPFIQLALLFSLKPEFLYV